MHAQRCTATGCVGVCVCLTSSDTDAEGALCRYVRVSDLQILVLKAYCVGVCVCLTSSDLETESVLCRCVSVSDLQTLVLKAYCVGVCVSDLFRYRY